MTPTPPPLLLASTSPQRRAILEQLRIPFEVAAPAYEERASPGMSAVDLVREHALEKARSLVARAGDRPVLGVDTAVVLGRRIYGKPESEAAAAEMLARLGGETHEVISGLCLLCRGWEVVEHESTRVSFRALNPSDISAYLALAEWQGRAGGYAIQGAGAALVERVEGDYLNVVGLPAALLVRVLSERLPGVYGFGFAEKSLRIT